MQNLIIAEIDNDAFYEAAFATSAVTVEVITPQVEFEQLFGRSPDKGDERLGLRRLIELQKLLLAWHGVTH